MKKDKKTDIGTVLCVGNPNKSIRVALRKMIEEGKEIPEIKIKEIPKINIKQSDLEYEER